jgi:hypothetical protein
MLVNQSPRAWSGIDGFREPAKTWMAATSTAMNEARRLIS